MSQNRAETAELQVHCLGNSADLGALRRSLESRGVVSRSRLTPAVRVVVADSTVPPDHPTLVAARDLGIEVIDPAEAIDRLLTVPGRTARWTSPTAAPRAPLVTLTVLVLVGVLALLGFVGSMIVDNGPREATVSEFSETVTPR